MAARESTGRRGRSAPHTPQWSTFDQRAALKQQIPHRMQRTYGIVPLVMERRSPLGATVQGSTQARRAGTHAGP
jgi:hypothetical protein